MNQTDLPRTLQFHGKYLIPRSCSRPLPIGDLGVLILIIVAYIILGMFLESIAMLVLTIPVVISIAVGLEWDLVWFGIIVVIVLEMGMISPPPLALMSSS